MDQNVNPCWRERSCIVMKSLFWQVPHKRSVWFYKLLTVMFMLFIDNFSFSVSILKSLFNENVGRLNQDFPKDNCLKVWYLLALQRFQLRPVTDSFCQPLNHKRPELITINYFFHSEIIFREKMVSLSNNDIFDNDKTFLRNVWHFSVITRINYVSIFLYLS